MPASSQSPLEKVYFKKWELKYFLNGNMKSLKFYVFIIVHSFFQIKMSRIGDRHIQEVLFQSIYMFSTVLSSDSGQLCIYSYSQNIEKNRISHTWATHICENIQCSHSSQLVHRWLVSKLWKETSKFSLRQQTQLLPECFPCPHQSFLNRKGSHQLFHC